MNGSPFSSHRSLYTVPPWLSTVILALVVVVATAGGLLAIRFLPPVQSPVEVANHWENSYRKVPESWIRYRPATAFPTIVDNPRCIATDTTGRIFIGGNRSIQVLEAETNRPLTSWSLEETPTSITVTVSESDANDTELSKTTQRVQCIVVSASRVDFFYEDSTSATGWRHRNSWTDQFLPDSLLTDVAVTNDSLYICDAGNRLVFVFSQDGTLRTTISAGCESIRWSQEVRQDFDTPETETTEDTDRIADIIAATHDGSGGGTEDVILSSATCFSGFVLYSMRNIRAVCSPVDGLLRITNPGKHRIETFTPDGKWIPEWSFGKAGQPITAFSGCCNPVSLAVLPDGTWITAEKAIPRIKRLRADGTLLSVVTDMDHLRTPPFAGAVYEPRDGVFHSVATLPNGDVVVLDPYFSAVRIFTPKFSPKSIILTTSL